MNKVLGRMALIALMSLLLGGIFLFVGIRLGGTTDFTYGPGEGGIGFHMNDEVVIKGKLVEKNLSLEDFDAIEVQVSSENVTIRRGDKNELHYILMENAVPETMEVRNGKLSIIRKGEIDGLMNLNTAFPEDTGIEITVDDDTLETLDLQLTSGSIDLETIDADDLRLKTTSGNVLMKPVGVEGDYNYQINVTSGKIKIGSMESDGKTFVKENGAKRNMEIETTSGNVSVLFQDE